MKQPLRLTFRKGDILAVALVIAIALATALAYLPKGSASGCVQVYQDNHLVHEFSLSENQSVTVTGSYANTITVQNGKVAITASDCPGEDCVHSGWIESVGRSIVCLPNRVEIRIAGTSDVDFVVG